MNEIQLKYGCNPNQKPSRIYMEDGSDLPVKVLNGKPGYINFLDAFNGWQLVKELKAATGLPAATSFKHVSPAGAAVGLPLNDILAKIYWVDDLGELSPLACAYARARGADRMSSFGDFIALSDVCDADTARLIKREVSDGVIAPGYTDEAMELLLAKKKGNYNIIQIDENYVPAEIERKQVYSVTFEQGRNELKIDKDLLSNFVTANKELPEQAEIDMKIALITLKYTQSNSVCYVKGGQAIGIGAGQQSRIHCTRLAGQKADNWFLRQSPQVMDLEEQTETMPSTYTWEMSTRMSLRKASGRRDSRLNQRCSQQSRRRHGWRRIQTLSLDQMHSSHSQTISRELTRVVSSTLHSRADQFVTILLLSVLTSTIWLWYLQESDYSITNMSEHSGGDGLLYS